MRVVRSLLAYSLHHLAACGCSASLFWRNTRSSRADWSVNIQFDPQDQPLDAAELHEILPLKMNQPLRMADVRASIERLFATGRYADIQVDARAVSRRRGPSRFVTKNSWFIGDVSVDGRVSARPTPGQLENATQPRISGSPSRMPSVERAVADQQRLLESNGLFQQPASNPVSTRRRTGATSRSTSASTSIAARACQFRHAGAHGRSEDGRSSDPDAPPNSAAG